MKAKAQTPQETSEKIQVEINPAQPRPYAAVNQIMPDGTKKVLGYVIADNPKNPSSYISKDFEGNIVWGITTELKEIETAFENYVKQHSRNERANELKGIRLQKYQNEKSISR